MRLSQRKVIFVFSILTISVSGLFCLSDCCIKFAHESKHFFTIFLFAKDPSFKVIVEKEKSLILIYEKPAKPSSDFSAS